MVQSTAQGEAALQEQVRKIVGKAKAVADLFAGFQRSLPPAVPGGLRGSYYQSKGMNKKEREVLVRTDPAVAFDLGTNSPAEGITSDQFSIAWAGSLIAPHTGVYEFRLRTPNGARLYVNEELRAGDSNRRDDSDARRASSRPDGAWTTTSRSPCGWPGRGSRW